DRPLLHEGRLQRQRAAERDRGDGRVPRTRPDPRRHRGARTGRRPARPRLPPRPGLPLRPPRPGRGAQRRGAEPDSTLNSVAVLPRRSGFFESRRCNVVLRKVGWPAYVTLTYIADALRSAAVKRMRNDHLPRRGFVRAFAAGEPVFV